MDVEQEYITRTLALPVPMSHKLIVLAEAESFIEDAYFAGETAVKPVALMTCDDFIDTFPEP